VPIEAIVSHAPDRRQTPRWSCRRPGVCHAPGRTDPGLLAATIAYFDALEAR
jgi:hypothetical protein